MAQAIAIQPAEATPIALELYSSVPRWAIVHAATDNRNAPLIREGEIVVVESNGAKGVIPEDGGLYLIEHVLSAQHPRGYETRVREIVQAYRGRRGGWYAGALKRGQQGRVIYCVDGPYRDELHLSEKILGRVVGIIATPSLGGEAR